MQDGGQSPERVNEAAKHGKIIGVDLGGTRVRAVLTDGSGKFLARTEKLTKAYKGKAYVIDRIVEVVNTIMDGADHSQIVGLGLGAPGPTNPHSGMVYSPPNLPGWTNVPLGEILEDRLKIPAYIGNDATLAALGEYTFGAGKDYRYLVYITVSTGIGGGIIDNGRMIEGAKGAAGEIGHMTIEPFGPRCNCGNQGCLEVLASGTGIRRRALEMLESGRKSLLTELSGGDLKKVDAMLVDQAARLGDQASIELIEQTAVYLGIGITNLLHLLNPEIIVFGGGVANSGDLMMQIITEEVNRRAMPIFRENLKLVSTNLGGDVGLYGAVALVLQHYDEAENHKLELLKKFAEEKSIN